MQHSAVDLENYARLYVDERLRDSEMSRRASQVAPGETLLTRAVAHLRSWFAAAPQATVSQVPTATEPAQLVPVVKQQQGAHADPYAGMIVLVRGPKEPCTLDAA